MRALRLALGALACTAFAPAATYAQACAGGPSLGTVNSGNVGVGASFFDGGKEYTAGATFGRSVFGSAHFSYADFDNTDLSLKTVSGGVGFEKATSSGVSVCPVVAVGYGFGFEILGIDVTTVSVSPGVALGVVAEVSPTVSVVPFGQVALVYSRTKADAGPLGEEADSQTHGVIALGVGFVFNDKVSLGPAVLIPVAADGGDTTFGVNLAVGVGGSR